MPDAPAVPRRNTSPGGGRPRNDRAAAGLNHGAVPGRVGDEADAAPAAGDGYGELLPLLLDKEDLCHHLRVSKRWLDKAIAVGAWPEADVKRGRKFRRWRRESVLAAVNQLASSDAPLPE